MTFAFTCETSDLADAVTRANSIAPVRGAAFDKAAGIEFEVGMDHPLVIRATDLEQTYLQRMKPTDLEGSGRFRLPSKVISGFIRTLDPSTQVRLEVGDKGRVSVTSETTEAVLVPIGGDSFPRVGHYPTPSEMAEAADFATCVKQVAWCTHRDKAPLTGVYLDGKMAVGCDGTKLAEVLCAVELDRPIAAPLTGMAGALTKGAEVRLAAGKNRLVVMPDDDTEITSVLYAEEYPKVDAIRGFVSGTTHTVELPAKGLLERLNRMLVLCPNERYPLVELTFHPNHLKLVMVVPDMGAMSDELGYASDEIDMVPHQIDFTPDILVSACNASSTSNIELGFVHGDKLKPIHITDGNGLSVVAMPRNVS